MKSIIKKAIIISLAISIGLLSNNTFAETKETLKGNKKTKVEVPIDFSSVFSGEVNCGGNKKDGYYCDVPQGTTGFQVIVAGIIKYLLFIASLAGVLFIVINGILYSMAGMNDSLKSESKTRIIKTLVGIMLLLTSGIILQVLAPWVYG